MAGPLIVADFARYGTGHGSTLREQKGTELSIRIASCRTGVPDVFLNTCFSGGGTASLTGAIGRLVWKVSMPISLEPNQRTGPWWE